MTHPFRTAVEAQDIEAAIACLAPDVEFYSPFAFRPFTGAESTAGVLRAVLETFEDFRYTDELTAPDGAHVLVFAARVGDVQLQGIDLLRSSRDDGRIEEFTVMVRPANGLMALGEAMAPKVAQLQKGAAPEH
jgi:limonene-1,2-epoxide hydrolase